MHLVQGEPITEQGPALSQLSPEHSQRMLLHLLLIGVEPPPARIAVAPLRADDHIRITALGKPATQKLLGNFNGKLTYCESVAEATKGADAVAIVTEWNEFITQDWKKIAKLMRGKHIFDGRNCLASGKVSQAGLFYHAIGRPDRKPGEGRPGTVGFIPAG